MKTSNKVIATGMSVALALTMTPVVALADGSVAQDAPAIEADSDGALTAADSFDWMPAEGYDKAEFYSEAAD